METNVIGKTMYRSTAKVLRCRKKQVINWDEHFTHGFQDEKKLLGFVLVSKSTIRIKHSLQLGRLTLKVAFETTCITQ